VNEGASISVNGLVPHPVERRGSHGAEPGGKPYDVLHDETTISSLSRIRTSAPQLADDVSPLTSPRNRLEITAGGETC
jgi:hypothetical protein